MHIRKLLAALMLLLPTGLVTAGVRPFAAQANVAVNFYGHSVAISYDPKINLISFDKPDAQTIKAFEAKMQATDYGQVLDKINATAAQYGLDDVGKILFINNFTETAFAGKSANFRTLLKWFIQYKDSMDVLLCYNSKEVGVYGRLNFSPYGVTYITKAGKTYSNLDFNSSVLTGKVAEYTPAAGYSVRKLFKLDKTKTPKLNALTKTKTISLNYMDKMHTYKCVLNKSLVEYYKDLPLLELGMLYVNYGFSESAKTSVLAQLRAEVKAMSKREALDFLLKFVQSLPYKTDQEYLGEERYSFPEEALYNDYADCEDKVILYAYLVKELLNTKCIMLHYTKDEHVAAAVQLPGETVNFSFKYKNVPYIAAEASGKGFDLGQLGFEVERVGEVIELY